MFLTNALLPDTTAKGKLSEKKKLIANFTLKTFLTNKLSLSVLSYKVSRFHNRNPRFHCKTSEGGKIPWNGDMFRINS